MKKLLLGLVALFAFVVPASAVDLAGIEAATFMLYKNGETICSSQVVHSAEGETILLTANHCVVGPEDTEFSIRTTDRDGRDVISYVVYMADVIKKDPKNDLAVLRIRDKDVTLPTTQIATNEETVAALFKGADVLAAGYPATQYSGMEDLVFSDGLFTGTRMSFMPDIEVDVYRTTAPVWYGKSGGGLYAKVGGSWKLVGVATQVDPETPWDTSLWIPALEVNKMLNGAWLDDKDLSDPAYTER